MFRMLLIGLGLCLDEGPAGREAEATDFVRFGEEKDGSARLETAVVTYAGPNGARVDLIAAVHVADAAYYRELEKRFRGYEDLYYEMIKPRGELPAAGEKSQSPVSFFQRAMKDALGLEFQLDAIDYSKKNFVHADLDPETFARLQREKGETILGLLWKLMIKNIERQGKSEREPPGLLEVVLAFTAPDSERRLKLLFARELEDMEGVLAGLEEGTKDGSVILGERNKVAIEAVKKGLRARKKKLAIFYGAGHMPDLERRLEEGLGFKKEKSEWLKAWDIPPRKEKEEAPR